MGSPEPREPRPGAPWAPLAPKELPEKILKAAEVFERKPVRKPEKDSKTECLSIKFSLRTSKFETSASGWCGACSGSSACCPGRRFGALGPAPGACTPSLAHLQCLLACKARMVDATPKKTPDNPPPTPKKTTTTSPCYTPKTNGRSSVRTSSLQHPRLAQAISPQPFTPSVRLRTQNPPQVARQSLGPLQSPHTLDPLMASKHLYVRLLEHFGA